MTNERDSNPKYVYDGLLRQSDGLEKYEKPRAIDLPDHTKEGKAYCTECHHPMDYDEVIDYYICSNPQCGVILKGGYKDAPLRDTDVLHTANDPYSQANKPIFINIGKPEEQQDYEDFGEAIFESAEEAMKETRRRNNFKTKPNRSIKQK